MQNEEILRYIAEERARGVREDDIKGALLAKGWKEDDVREGMNAKPSSVAPAAPSVVLVSAGDLLRTSWNEMKDHFSLIASILSFPVACYVIVGILNHGRAGTGSMLSLVLLILGFILLLLATIGVIKQVRLGWTLSIKETYDVGIKYFWVVLWVSVLTGLATIGATILLIVPGIIVGIWLSFSRPAVILDEAKGLQSLSYSRALVSGLWWPVFWRIVVMAFVVWVVDLIASFVPYVGQLSYLVTVPFASIYSVHLYDALKAHKGISYAEHKPTDKGIFLALAVLGAILIPLAILAFMWAMGVGSMTGIAPSGFLR